VALTTRNCGEIKTRNQCHSATNGVALSIACIRKENGKTQLHQEVSEKSVALVALRVPASATAENSTVSGV